MAQEFVMGAKIQMKDNVSQVMKTAAKASATFKDATGKLGTKMDEYGKKAKKAQDATKSFGSSIASMVKAVAAGAAVKVGFDWLVKGNADMETYKNTLAVVMKSNEKAVQTLAWAEKFAADTPFEIPQIVEATTRMTAYGLNAQKTLGIVGDMASVMGKDLMQAVEAVADAQTGELERLKEFGITKDMITKQAKLMGATVVNKKGQITDQKAFNAALFKIMEDRYKGGMALQAKTWKGMLSNASDFIGRMGRKLGAPLFEKMKTELANGLEYLNKLEKSGAIDAFMNKVAAAIPIVKNAAFVIGAVLAPAIIKSGVAASITAAKDFWKLITSTYKYIAAGWSAVASIVAQTAAFIAQGVTLAAQGVAWLVLKGIQIASTAVTWAMTAAQWALNAAFIASPVGWIALGIIAIVAAGILLYKNWDLIKQKAVEVWTTIKSWINKTPDWLLLMVAPILLVVKHFDKIKAVVLQVWDTIVKTFSGMATWFMTNVVTPIYNIMPDWLKKFLGGGKVTVKATTTNGANTASMAVNGSHKNGLSYVPFDNYKANLHKGERILTEEENRAYSVNPAGNVSSNSSTSNSTNIKTLVGKITINGAEGKDGKQLANEIITELYDRLKNAANITSGADMGVLLNG